MINLGLSGKMGSGKSTVSEALAKKWGYEVNPIGSEIKRLAVLLIEDPKAFDHALSSVMGISPTTQQVLLQIHHFFLKHFKTTKWVKEPSGMYLKTNDYRYLLQELPTMVRDQLGEDIFAKLLAKRLEPSIQKGENLISDDVRLPEEKEILESRGFYIIRLDIEREEQLKRLKEKYGEIDEDALNHRTETALDDAKFDLRIDVTHKDVKTINEEIETFLNSVKKH